MSKKTIKTKLRNCVLLCSVCRLKGLKHELCVSTRIQTSFLCLRSSDRQLKQTGEDSGNIRDITDISPSWTKKQFETFYPPDKTPTFAGCRFVQTHQNNLYLKSVWQDERVLAALAALAVCFLPRNKSLSTTQRHSCSFCLTASSSQEQLGEIQSIFRDKRSGLTNGDVTIISNI